MAEENLPLGGPILGFGRSTPKQPNTFSLWQYVLIVFVLVIGAIYAAPNVFQPDPALQLRSASQQIVLEQSDIDKATKALADAGIPVVGSELVDGTGLIRVDSDENQLKARNILSSQFAAGEYIVALNRASTTPTWLEDIGGKPMSLGLDLSGAAHPASLQHCC